VWGGGGGVVVSFVFVGWGGCAVVVVGVLLGFLSGWVFACFLTIAMRHG